jgi:hypothetical protein
MADTRKLAATVLETILATYPEDDPRARARRFSPLYANIGIFIAAIIIFMGAIALMVFLPYDNWVENTIMALYGAFSVPMLFLITWVVVKNLNSATIRVLRLKDKIVAWKNRNKISPTS